LRRINSVRFRTLGLDSPRAWRPTPAVHATHHTGRPSHTSTPWSPTYVHKKTHRAVTRRLFVFARKARQPGGASLFDAKTAKRARLRKPRISDNIRVVECGQPSRERSSVVIRGGAHLTGVTQERIFHLGETDEIDPRQLR
jgi:hypothetical protein